MANPRFSNVAPTRGKNGKGPGMAKTAPGAKADMPMKTAAWPGLPGKTGPNRSNGVAKIKAYPKSEGI
jgi:hypothetical protein